jgi:hypothetical protein
VYLDKAFNFADNQDLLVELWFYRLAHCPDYRQQAIEQLDKSTISRELSRHTGVCNQL